MGGLRLSRAPPAARSPSSVRRATALPVQLEISKWVQVGLSSAPRGEVPGISSEGMAWDLPAPPVSLASEASPRDSCTAGSVTK